MVQNYVMRINRVWAMPSAETFTIPPIRDFAKRYLRDSKISVDPFARNCGWATYTNDLNPNTTAQHHMDAFVFLEMLRDKGIRADLVLFDPPYSPRQIKECYNNVGIVMNGDTAHKTAGWKLEKDILCEIMPINSFFLHFGWHSNGMGKKRGFEIVEILLVAHGAAHNDTICMSEKRVAHQLSL